MAKIEKRNQSPKPDDAPLILESFLPYRLSIAAESISRLFAVRYEERFGLTIPEWRVLAVVGEAGRPTTQDVIKKTSMDPVRVSRAVIRLSDKGLLKRSVNPNDQRAQILTISATGMKLYRDIVPLALSTQSAIAEALTAEERDQLVRLLDKVTDWSRRLLNAAAGNRQERC